MDKDEGLSSFAVVRRVRGLLGGVRAGHAGSLDPFATGLIPVCVGRATRLVRFVMSGTKRYRAFVRFGQATDTDDLTGQPVGLPAECPDASAIEQALAGFPGNHRTAPPPVLGETRWRPAGLPTGSRRQAGLVGSSPCTGG